MKSAPWRQCRRRAAPVSTMGIAFLALALVARAARAVDTYVAAETSYVTT